MRGSIYADETGTDHLPVELAATGFRRRSLIWPLAVSLLMWAGIIAGGGWVFRALKHLF